MTAAIRRAAGAPSPTPGDQGPIPTPPSDRSDTPPAATGTAAPRHGHPTRAVTGLVARLLRRSTVLMAVAMAAYAALEIASYRSAYPEGISPVQFQMFEDNPAVRMLSGVPYALDTAAGFAIWDAGWIWQLILAVWAILTTTRFLRGDEDSDRADLMLAGPIRATAVTATVLAVVTGAGLLVGAVVTATMALSGQQLASSALLGLALAGITATFAAVAGVTCQLVEVRRRAAGLATAALGVAWLLRMVADSADERGWLRWLSPLGWTEQLKLYGQPEPWALVPILLAPVALALAAVAMRARRDTGAALLVSESGREPRLRRLGSPAAFAWRSHRAVLLAWLLGVGAYAAIMGGLVGTMIDWLASDEGYQRILAQMGLDQALTNRGFLAVLATILGMAVALQVAWRFGAVRAEEESGRLEAILARPVTRLRWLVGHTVLTLTGGLLLLVVVGNALWLGAAASGASGLTWWDAMRSALNLAPIVALTAGIALAAFGTLPRLTVAVPAGVVVLGFVLSMLGPALDWPRWVLDLSPFTHLALVPAEPWAAAPALVMTSMAIALAVTGLVGFGHRDLTTS